MSEAETVVRAETEPRVATVGMEGTPETKAASEEVEAMVVPAPAAAISGTVEMAGTADTARTAVEMAEMAVPAPMVRTLAGTGETGATVGPAAQMVKEVTGETVEFPATMGDWVVTAATGVPGDLPEAQEATAVMGGVQLTTMVPGVAREETAETAVVTGTEAMAGMAVLDL